MNMTIEQLEKVIAHHNDLYWNNKPLEVSDVEYDALVEQLRKLDPNNKLLNVIGNQDVNPNQKLIKHDKPMLSLGKVYSFGDLYNWITKVSRSEDEVFLIQPKYDGMSGLLENGKLSSRGDGIYGQDYTDKLQLIEFDLPKGKTINVSKDYLLGEIVIRNSDFKSKQIKNKNGEFFKTQRNGIAGIIGTDDVQFYKKQGAVIAMVDYDLISYRCSKKQFSAMVGNNKWNDLVEKIVNTVNYPLDGIVVKLADKKYSESLGCTAHHPRGQIAFKFTNQSKQSKLIGVEWGMGKEQLSAIGLIEPIELSGVTIKRVKLQLTEPKNTDVKTCLINKSLQIGDIVVVERAGDIIPHVTDSFPGAHRTPVIIRNCPFCGHRLEINKTSVKCVNENCKERVIQNLYNSIVALQFKNVGDKFVRLIVDKFGVDNLYDLLTVKLDQMDDSVFGVKTKENFINEIKKATKEGGADKINFLTALNIPGIGKSVSKILVDNFKWNDIINNNINYTKLCGINGIGYIIADTIEKYFNKNRDLVIKLNSLFVFDEDNQNNTLNDSPTVCFTGKMEMKRSDMMKLARLRGLCPVETVDKNLDILVCADPNSGSSKLQKAAKYGIRIISEEDFKNGVYSKSL